MSHEGKLAAVTNASGFVVEYEYDIMDRVTNISWKTASGATLGGFGYEYAAVGRIVSRSHELGDASHPSHLSQSSHATYAYDDLDRLASDGGVTYTYDAAGNRTTRMENGITTTYTLGVGDRLVSWTGGSYTYDFAGNVTRIERDGMPTLELAWNSQYQLVSVATNGVFAEGYEYDALGRRASTRTLEGTTRHVYDNNWQVIADLDEDGDVVASYTWGDGIDNLLAVSIGGATYYPLTDIQGTVWGYVDSQNNVVARWQYDAWGNVVDESVSVPELASLRYRFQCREWSVATGLVHFRMRWYDPETGRWLSKDPIGLSGGLNLYAFCDDDPVNSIDPWGLCEDDDRGVVDKIVDGYYLGTGFGESALNYYCSILDNPESTYLEKAGAYVGGGLSALWTRETYVRTATTLISAYSLRNVAHNSHVDVNFGDKPKIQFRYKDNPKVRIEKAPFGKGADRNMPRWHYHRQGHPIGNPLNGPGKMKHPMDYHRPYEGGW